MCIRDRYRIGGLEEGQMNLKERQMNLEKGQMNLEKGQEEIRRDQEQIRRDQEEIKRDIKAIIEQTAELTEFRYEINDKIDKLAEEFYTMEIVTSKNWNDIAKLKAAR